MQCRWLHPHGGAGETTSNHAPTIRWSTRIGFAASLSLHLCDWLGVEIPGYLGILTVLVLAVLPFLVISLFRSLEFVNRRKDLAQMYREQHDLLAGFAFDMRHLFARYGRVVTALGVLLLIDLIVAALLRPRGEPFTAVTAGLTLAWLVTLTWTRPAPPEPPDSCVFPSGHS